ncbi:hypothetical protein ABEB36_007232 [Hypothenemus hampei]|uniref:Uncharacterized protein n=1 Tax=Hypothenemus hampei TaxID=57062 RepID=A0ABD1EWC3_HYPHA
MALEDNNRNDNSLMSPNNDFYPFYVVKNRPRVSSRRSSVQSFSKRHKFKLVRRLVRKSGKSSIHQKNNTERSFRFLLDLSNTLIECSWIWTLSIVTLIFILTWLMFAGFWAIISIDNVDSWNGTVQNCLEGIDSFSGYLLFSIETQTTVGYGGRHINEYCPEAIIGLVIQLILGAGVCGSLICIVFLKMVGPMKNPNSLVCFSKKAVICQRDGELCLIFRVRDYDMRYECHTKIVAYLAEERGGELSLKTLKLEPTGILIWPVEVIHKIDETSPFWDFSAKDLILKRLEIIAVLEGECSATSYLSRTTTSYLSREIRWGHIFTPCTRWNKCLRKYVVDHRHFNKTMEISIPLCSAKRLSEVYDDIVYQSVSVYPESSILSSKLSSPSTIASPKYYRKSDVPDVNELESDEEEGNLTKIMISHHDDLSDEDSECENYPTFMDLSVEDLARRKKKRDEVLLRNKSNNNSEPRVKTFSGTAKDFLTNLQNKYLNKTDKKYEETAF